ncbi:MAG: hypothetical protein RJA70_4781 [Pseudomonadota bacterium]|jgi:hypothetical protein
MRVERSRGAAPLSVPEANSYVGSYRSADGQERGDSPAFIGKAPGAKASGVCRSLSAVSWGLLLLWNWSGFRRADQAAALR